MHGIDYSSNALSDVEPINCIYDTSKKCGYPDSLKTSSTPKVFVISSTEFNNVVSWFKDIFDKHVRTEQGDKFDVIYFTDTSTWDFCNNVCIPIYESWFCIAIIKKELLPQYAKRINKEILTGFITRLNANVFFEVGLALSRKKDIIFYKGCNQDLPSDWSNLVKLVLPEPSIFLSPEDNEKMIWKLKEIIRLNPSSDIP